MTHGVREMGPVSAPRHYVPQRARDDEGGDVRERLAVALEAAMAAAVGRSMHWGVDDCATWAGDIVLAATGSDPMARFRGRYTTALGYRRVLRREGFANLNAAIVSVAGQNGWRQLVGSDNGKVGDIGVVSHGGGLAIAVSKGNGFWIARAPAGWAALTVRLMGFEVVPC